MAIEWVPKDRQTRGAFDGGKILENKPVGFPQEEGGVGSFSNLFYWAHAWSDAGGLIGEHPHEGFEIMSYVLKGEIEHYDSQLKGWKKLIEGDVQLIRAGSGITHAERLLAGSGIFQIWFDPDLSKALRQPATYDDYAAARFPVNTREGVTTKSIKGGGAPMTMNTEGVGIEEHALKTGNHTFPLDVMNIYAAYVIGGALEVGSRKGTTDDFFLIKGEREVKVVASMPSRLFVIHVPSRPSYRTYGERQRG